MTLKEEKDEQINTRKHQVKHHEPSGKGSPEAIIVESSDVTNSVGENRSLLENHESVEEKEELIVADEAFFAPPKNEIQSIESVILKSALAKKGPIFPKVFKRIKNRFQRKNTVAKMT